MQTYIIVLIVSFVILLLALIGTLLYYYLRPSPSTPLDITGTWNGFDITGKSTGTLTIIQTGTALVISAKGSTTQNSTLKGNTFSLDQAIATVSADGKKITLTDGSYLTKQ